jgi:hypothetical protein
MNVRVSRKDSREYLRLHQLEPYFEDAARQALVQGDRPAERLRAYFRRVLAMRQVVGREYAYVSATAWNRRSFVVVFREAIQNLLGEHLTVGDFHQLLQLVCPDFPRATLDAIVHVLPRALINDGLASCATLATAFEVHWFHAKFLGALDPFFRRLVTIDPVTRSSVALPAPAPAPGDRTAPSTPSSALPVGDLAAAVTYLNASKASHQAHPAAISWAVVERSLAAAGFSSAVSFRRLCQCLIQSESLAARLHARPRAKQAPDDHICALVEGRATRRSAGDGDKKKADADDAKADDRALSPPTKPAQKRGKTARKKPAPAATNDDAAP